MHTFIEFLAAGEPKSIDNHQVNPHIRHIIKCTCQYMYI